MTQLGTVKHCKARKTETISMGGSLITYKTSQTANGLYKTQQYTHLNTWFYNQLLDLQIHNTCLRL